MSSAGQHYELSSHRKTRNRQMNNTTHNYVVGGTRKASDSEDELVKDETSNKSSVSNIPIVQNKDGITLTTEYEVYEENGRGSRNIDRFDV
jgi:hypothetical protein